MKTFSSHDPAKVLVVDDSALMRQVLTSIIDSDPGLKVVDTAMDPFAAREKIKRLNPDVITLDIEMPRMSGIAFLQKLMALRPTPVVMISSLTQAGAALAVEALEIGAVDAIGKPSTGGAGLLELRDEIVAKVKAAAGSRTFSVSGPAKTGGARATALDPNKVILIGASTGGIPAVQHVLQGLPADAPPVVIVQHMPVGFTSRFASRLADICAIEVSEAVNGDRLRRGHCYIAPAGFQTRLVRRHDGYELCVSAEGRYNGFSPSVDVMFSSAARACGRQAVGVLLTGMGSDGAQGLLEILHADGQTLGQDEASSVVYGMPRVAWELGAVQQQLPITRIPQALIKKVSLSKRPEDASHVPA